VGASPLLTPPEPTFRGSAPLGPKVPQHGVRQPKAPRLRSGGLRPSLVPVGGVCACTPHNLDKNAWQERSPTPYNRGATARRSTGKACGAWGAHAPPAMLACAAPVSGGGQQRGRKPPAYAARAYFPGSAVGGGLRPSLVPVGGVCACTPHNLDKNAWQARGPTPYNRGATARRQHRQGQRRLGGLTPPLQC